MEQTGKGKFIFRYLSGQTDGATAPQRDEAKRNRADKAARKSCAGWSEKKLRRMERDEAKRNRADKAARKSCAIWSEMKQREKEANYGKEEEGHH